MKKKLTRLIHPGMGVYFMIMLGFCLAALLLCLAALLLLPFAVGLFYGENVSNFALCIGFCGRYDALRYK